MPKVQFLVNLGSRDAQAFGLDFTECTKGSVVDLDAEAIVRLKKACGEFVVGVPEAKAKVEAKAPTDAELEKLTAPKK